MTTKVYEKPCYLIYYTVHFKQLIFLKDASITYWRYAISILSSTVKGFLQNIRDVFEAGIFIIFLREGNVGIPEKRKDIKRLLLTTRLTQWDSASCRFDQKLQQKILEG